MTKVFCLGTGLEIFFFIKLGLLMKRFEELYSECISRGFSVEYYGNAWKEVPKDLMGGYLPTSRDRSILIDRINERIEDMKSKHLLKGRLEDIKRLNKFKL